MNNSRICVIAALLVSLALALSCGMRSDVSAHLQGAEPENARTGGDGEPLTLETLAPLIEAVAETQDVEWLLRVPAQERAMRQRKRYDALRQLRTYGPRAKEAAPEIIRILIESNHDFYDELLPVVKRLGGDDALRTYYRATAEQLQNAASVDFRRRSAERLEHLWVDVDDDQVFRCLREAMLHDADTNVRRNASFSLRNLHNRQRNKWSQAKIEGLVDAYVSLLRDQDKDVREAGAIGLEGMGSDAAPAVEPLLEAVNDPDRHVRRHAIVALGAIGPAAKQANLVLLEQLRSENPVAARLAHPSCRSLEGWSN